MPNKPSGKITQIHDKSWLWFQRFIQNYIRLWSASSRWGFAAFLLAFSLLFISLAPSLRTLEGEMTVLGWLCYGTGILTFLVLLSFISFISRHKPEDGDTDKSFKALIKRLDDLIEEIRQDRNERNKSK